MPRKSSTRFQSNPSADLGFEAKLWLAADKLRSGDLRVKKSPGI